MPEVVLLAKAVNAVRRYTDFLLPYSRSVIVLPSSYTRGGELRSRIVAALDPGAPVTVPRSAVDYVVTERGIATLRGKPLRRRIGELIAVAHPDCRPQLKEDARRLYGWAV